MISSRNNTRIEAAFALYHEAQSCRLMCP